MNCNFVESNGIPTPIQFELVTSTARPVQKLWRQVNVRHITVIRIEVLAVVTNYRKSYFK